jgi:hypothetical protein
VCVRPLAACLCCTWVVKPHGPTHTHTHTHLAHTRLAAAVLSVTASGGSKAHARAPVPLYITPTRHTDTLIRHTHTSQVNEAVNDLLIDEEDFEGLRASINTYDNFDQVRGACWTCYLHKCWTCHYTRVTWVCLVGRASTDRLCSAPALQTTPNCSTPPPPPPHTPPGWPRVAAGEARAAGDAPHRSTGDE